jgi:hypothetical protein
MRHLNCITAPYAEPIHLTEVKKHLRVDLDDDDDLIQGYIAAARYDVEFATDRQLVAATWMLHLDQFPYGKIALARTEPQMLAPFYGPRGEVELAKSPLLSLTSVRYKDSSATWQTLATTQYVVDATIEPPQISLVYGVAWPIAWHEEDVVQITFVSGHLIPFTADPTTDFLTLQGGAPTTGAIVRLSNSGGSLPAGLAPMTDYYIIGASGITCQLSATLGGAAIDIADAGTGLNFVGELPAAARQAIFIRVADYYEQRQDKVSGASSSFSAFDALCRQLKDSWV